MTQSIRFVDDTTYTYDDFAEVFNNLHGIDFVIPDGDDLDAASTGGSNGSLTISAGRAVVKGVMYKNDATETIQLSAQGGGLNRIDRIVLRRDTANQTVRLTVIEGTAAVNPAIPSLTADDMALYYVYVPDGFTTSSIIDNANIHDERVFNHPVDEYDYYGSIRNLIINPEFMAYSDPTSGAGIPEFWRSNIAAGSIAATTVLSGRSPRGRALNLTLANNEWVEFATYKPYGKITGTDFVLTLKGSLQITTGEVNISIKDQAGTDLVSRDYKITGTLLDFTIRCKIDYTTYSAITAIRVHIENTAGAGNITLTLNPMFLARGYLVGPISPTHEILPLSDELTDANWNDTAKTNGSHSIDLDTDFSGIVLPGTRGIIGRIRARGSNTAAAATYLLAEANNYALRQNPAGGGIYLRGHPNNIAQEEFSLVGINQEDNTFSIYALSDAIGDIKITYYIVGVVT